MAYSTLRPDQERAWFCLLPLGKTGSGKSSLCNRLTRDEKFPVSNTMCSETRVCQVERRQWHGETIEIMDTPGFEDTSNQNKDVTKEVLAQVPRKTRAPIIALYVVSMRNKYTEAEFKIYERLKIYYRPEHDITRNMIVVFTNVDVLEQNASMTPEAYLPNIPDNLQKVLDECSGRFVVFNNQSSSQEQVEDLFDMAKWLVQDNGGLRLSRPLDEKPNCRKRVRSRQK